MTSALMHARVQDSTRLFETIAAARQLWEIVTFGSQRIRVLLDALPGLLH
jgi:hypothetical protein